MINFHRRTLKYLAPPLLMGLAGLAQANVVPAGAGSYTTEKPSHRWQPATAEGYDQTVPPGEPWGIYTPRQPQSPSVSEHFLATGKPTPTHEFWSSVVWEFSVTNLIRTEHGGVVETDTSMVPYSHWMSNAPYTMKFTNRGVNLTYAPTPLLVPYRYEDPNTHKPVLPSVDAPKFTAYTYPARIDPSLEPLGGTELNVRFEGLDAEETLLDDYSDFSGTVLLNNPGSPETSDYAKVTMVNGSPFLYFEKNGLGDVTFTYFNGTRIIHESDGTLALYLGDVRTGYAIFAPSGTEFFYTLANLDLQELTARGEITMSLPAGHDHFTVAILPNEINDILRAPNAYNDHGFMVEQGMTVNELPTHIEGTHQPLVVASLVGDFFREEDPAIADLDNLILDYRSHAFTIPVDTRFDFAYDETNAEVIANFHIDNQLLIDEPGLQNTTLMGLYRHQYINMDDVDYAYTYSSARGEMRIIKANSFQTRTPHIGLLPNLPNVLEGAELDRLLSLLDRDKDGQWGDDGLTRNDVLDTYYNGKELNWMLQLLHIAEQTGETETAQLLMAEMKEHIEDWLSADDWQDDTPYDNSHCENHTGFERDECYQQMRLANEKKYFYYNEEWNSLTGFPASFGSDTELNDHHFHSGYIISAAAAIARYDRDWAQAWKPMVDLLIKDSANWDRQDTQFQYLRYFDIYSGYSLANGHLNMDAGGNQESSSESINFAQAVALWGSETGDQAIRDLGIFLYASEIQAIHQYWFDVDSKVFPKDVFWDNGGQFVRQDFDRSSVGMVWHSKADYGTWFAAIPRMIAGINFLPITAASLHLGHMEKQLDNGTSIPSVQLVMDRLDENTAFFAEQMWHNPPPAGFEQYDPRRRTHFWDDLMWMAEALANPYSAADKFEAAGDYVREFHPSMPPMYPNAEVRGEQGQSTTHTYHWIYNLAALGTPVVGITADTAHFAVFEKNGHRTYAVYNPTDETKIVRFSDGMAIEVGPRQLSGGNEIDLPPAVSNIVANDITIDSAQISWDPLSGDWTGAFYLVTVTDSSGDQILSKLAVAGHALELSKLQSGSQYSVRITSVFDNLNGRSANFTFTTEYDLSVVPAVENLNISEISINEALATWSPIDTAYTNVDYRIVIMQGSQIISEVNSTGAATEYRLSNLEPETSYSISIWASYNGIESLPTTASFTTEPQCDPTQVDYCIDAAVSSVRILLNHTALWADIHLNSPTQNGGYRMPKNADGQSYFDVVGLTEGSEVNFRFTYFDTAGREIGPFSYTHSVSEPGTIPVVSGLSADQITQTSAQISWDLLTGEYAAASYTLEVYESDNLVHTETVSGGTATLANLTPATLYRVGVRATLDSSLGEVAETTFTTNDENSDPVITNCQEISGRQICHESRDGNLVITLEAHSWAIVHTASGGYQMTSSGDGQFTYAFSNLVNGDSINAWFTINTPTGAMDTGTATFTYEENTVTIPPVSNLQIQNVQDTEASVQWSAPVLEPGSPAADYQVTLIRGSQIEQLIASTNGQTSIDLTNLTSGTDYRLDVQTLINGTSSDPVSTAFTTTGESTNTCNQQPGEVCTETVGSALRVKLYGATGWATIHSATGNYHMTAGSEGEFYFDFPNVPIGTTLTVWFTVNTPNGAYNSDSYQVSH